MRRVLRPRRHRAICGTRSLPQTSPLLFLLFYLYQRENQHFTHLQSSTMSDCSGCEELEERLQNRVDEIDRLRAQFLKYPQISVNLLQQIGRLEEEVEESRKLAHIKDFTEIVHKNNEEENIIQERQYDYGELARRVKALEDENGDLYGQVSDLTADLEEAERLAGDHGFQLGAQAEEINAYAEEVNGLREEVDRLNKKMAQLGIVSDPVSEPPSSSAPLPSSPSTAGREVSISALIKRLFLESTISSSMTLHFWQFNFKRLPEI